MRFPTIVVVLLWFFHGSLPVNSLTTSIPIPTPTPKPRRSWCRLFQTKQHPTTTNHRIGTHTSHQTPIHQRILLVGGGHAHLQVIKAFNQRDRPVNWQVTLIDKCAFASYSGMVPGCVSGQYTNETAQIALRPLSEWAGIEFVQDTVVGIDVDSQQVSLKSGTFVKYDVLSLDIGSMSKGTDTPGVLKYAIPTRPIDQLVNRLQDAKKRLSKGDTLVVVGGGIAGIELAMCISSGFRSIVDDSTVTILDSGTELIPFESEVCREGLQHVLNEQNIRVRYDSRVTNIEHDRIKLEDGSCIPFTHCVWSTGACPHHPLSSQLKRAGISVSTDGWIQVGPTLQTKSQDAIFAAGDCASIEGLVDSISQNAKQSPPKAGVYAVRSGPILIENISRFLKNKSPNEPPYEPLLRFDPQEDFLKLIGCGDETAIGFRWGLFLRGKWVWELKDAIDTTFMDLFKVDNLPDFSLEDVGSSDGKKAFDTSQYDDYVKKPERLSPEKAGKLLLRQDDDVNYQDAWDVIREMATDDEYKEDVLKYCQLQSPSQIMQSRRI